MATISPNLESNQRRWQTIVSLTLGFWLSACIILDLVIMPSMYVSGMMNTPDFTVAGSVMFSVFNRVELLCSTLGLTGLLVLSATTGDLIKNSKFEVIFLFPPGHLRQLFSFLIQKFPPSLTYWFVSASFCSNSRCLSSI